MGFFEIGAPAAARRLCRDPELLARHSERSEESNLLNAENNPAHRGSGTFGQPFDFGRQSA
jgi:hypothetical protein